MSEENKDQKVAKTGFIIAVSETGELVFNVIGTDPNVVTLQGLLSIAEKLIDSRTNDLVSRMGSPQAPTAVPAQVELPPPDSKKKASRSKAK